MLNGFQPKATNNAVAGTEKTKRKRAVIPFLKGVKDK